MGCVQRLAEPCYRQISVFGVVVRLWYLGLGVYVRMSLAIGRVETILYQPNVAEVK